MVPFKETINSKEELIEACKKGFEDYSNKRISKNDFCMYFGFTHGEAITKFYGGNYEQLLVDGGFNSGSGAYFAGGINAWKNLKNGKYIFPPFIKEDSRLNIANSQSFQQIFYGAPGTGKSHETNKIVSEYSDTIRTTFHPDSDYSTFVGAYKPTMDRVKKTVIIGEDEKDVKPESYENKIIYAFRKQAFLKAYIKAWKKMCEETNAPQFLVIEEINRGNCAQIFGDLFQLLDRKNGYSEYPIEADDDIRKALIEDDPDGLSFGSEGLQLPEEIKHQIDEICKGNDIADKVCKGELLLLPPNFYIWATMNTSDQSLFPIDSAFKRRWDWKYMPIVDADKKWKIVTDKKKYDWWSFLEKINNVVGDLTSSEDKKLGYFFCKAVDGVIDADKFVNKVIFYLWNDVVKDYDLSQIEAFKDEDGKSLTFEKFYKDRERAIERFMTNLGVEVVGENGSGYEGDLTDEEIEQNKFDRTKYRINGGTEVGKSNIPLEAVKVFVENRPDLSLDDIVNEWKKIDIRYIVETEEMHEERRKKAIKDKKFDTRSKELSTQKGVLYVSNQIGIKNVNQLIDQIHAQNWGIKIEKV